MHYRSLVSAIVMLAPALAFASTNGCHSGDDSPVAADGGNVVQPPVPTKDSGPPPPELDSGPTPFGCPGNDEINATTFPWKPPTRAPGSCSDAEVDAMIAFIETSPSATFKQLQDSITNATCRDCVFAKETTTWAPIILNAAGTGVVALNVGGCPAIVSGKDECGKAIQQWNDCLDAACVDCGGGNDCATAANKKVCKKAFDAVVGAAGCGDPAAAQAALDACNKPEDKYAFIGGVRAQCVGLSDAGDGGGD